MTLKNLTSASNKFYEDQALIFLTFGGFGRYVLSLLHSEFRRLGIPESKASFLAFDTEKPHRDRLDLDRESEYFIHLDEFEGDVYVQNKENEQLKEQVSHIPTNLLCDIEGGCKGVPAVGFVAFHKYDDLVVTKQTLALIDKIRGKNPGKRIKLIVISGMAGSVSNGMTVPALYRIRNRLREKKVRVEVYLATSEGYIGLQNIQEQNVEKNCVASAMLWEYAMAGRNGLVYPGKSGFRDKRMFDGRIAHRTYIFSGGSAETSLKYEAVASTIAQCISTLELTKLGSYLDGDRVNYSAHILERQWKGKAGQEHPTALVTMNAAGVKGDCLPQIFHLHTARRFFEHLIRPLTHQEADKINGKALSCFLENGLNKDDILNQFSVDIPTLTSETINEAGVTEENIYDFLMDKITEINETGAELFEKKKNLEDISIFVEEVTNSFSLAGDDIILMSGNSVKGSFLLYEKLVSLLDKQIANVSESITRLEEDLIEGQNQKALNNLLDRLGGVSKKKGIGELVVKLGGQSPTVTLVNQTLDAASKVHQQRKDKYSHLVLKHIYDSVSKFLRNRLDMLRSVVYQYNKLISDVDRDVEQIKRIGRSAFTYNKVGFDELTEHLMEQVYSRLEVTSTEEIMAKLGPQMLLNDKMEERGCLERVLEITRPDLGQLTRVVDELFCEDKMVYDYLKTMLGQFFMTLKLDRDRFPSLETSQSAFVICTKKFHDKYKDDLFDGYWHIETENPFNVIVTRHEEGFPFVSISYLHRINEEFKELRARGESAGGHIMGILDEKLPLLDD